MTKDTLLMLIGAFIALLPFLGFPNSWDTVLLVISGACVIALGIAVRRGERPARVSKPAPRPVSPSPVTSEEGGYVA